MFGTFRGVPFSDAPPSSAFRLRYFACAGLRIVESRPSSRRMSLYAVIGALDAAMDSSLSTVARFVLEKEQIVGCDNKDAGTEN